MYRRSRTVSLSDVENGGTKEILYESYYLNKMET